MKKVLKEAKALRLLLLSVFLVSFFAMPVFAVSQNQQGVVANLVTDKTSYEADETITTTVTVTNNGTNVLKNVHIQYDIPEKYELANGSKNEDTFESVAHGDTVKLTGQIKKSNVVTVTPAPDNSQPAENTETVENVDVTQDNGTAANTFDSHMYVLFMVLFILSGSVLAAGAVKNKKLRKVLSVFFCFFMVFSMLDLSAVNAKADTVAESTMNLNRTITVDGNELELNAQIRFNAVNEDTNTVFDESKTYTRGEWVTLLLDKLNAPLMSADQIDYYYLDSLNSATGTAVETANAYGFLPVPDVEDLEQDIPLFYPDEPCTREFAAYTAVHAMGFNGENTIAMDDWSDANQVKYKDEIKIALVNNFLYLTDNTFYPQKTITGADVKSIFYAIDDLNESIKLSKDQTYDHSEILDSVVNVAAEGVTCEYNSNGSITADDSGLYPLSINAGGSTEIPGTLEFTIAEKEITDNLKVSGSVEVEIPDITCIAKANVGWRGVDVDEFTLSISEKIKIASQLELTLAESGYELTNSNGATRFESGRIEIGRLPIRIGATGLSFDIVFFCNVSAKGTASITYTINSTQGYQYKNGASRAIFDFYDSLDFMEIKASGTAGLGLSGVLCAFNLIDLAGYAGEAGIGFNGSFTPHILATDTLYCGDMTLYAYAKSGIDQETVVGKFLNDVCHYTLEFQHLDNDSSNPFKAKFHVENGRVVPECTFGTGELKGLIASADGNEPIAGARIRIYSGETLGENLVRTIYTDETGNYSVDNLTAGTYSIEIAATGYKKYDMQVEITENATVYNETLLMIGRNGEDGVGTVTGELKDALTGLPIQDMTYNIRKDWNNTTGAVLETGTFDASTYELSLNPGNYTLEIIKENYITNHINIAVVLDETKTYNVTLSPENSSIDTDNLRIVLTWGEYPWDLDSHLYGKDKLTDSDVFHTCYWAKNYYQGSTAIAKLDVDDTTSYGPETTTIYELNDNMKYSYYVHDYTNGYSSSSTAMAASGAKVQVYAGNVCYFTFNVPNKGGIWWHVFDYDSATDALTPVNAMSYSN
uniref:carboxypeptidase regulatory-like domain-containing protein n=1 Tax=Lachnospira sp. TaxID=2049031 RepID=UPI003FEDC985